LRPDGFERGRGKDGWSKRNKCVNTAYERSELVESCLASLAENDDPARSRQTGPHVFGITEQNIWSKLQ
jgi:hypothetical protein